MSWKLGPMAGLLMAAMLAASAASYAQAPTAPAAPTPAAPPAAAPALPPPLPFPEALDKALGDVLQNVKVAEGARLDLLIDPLVDGNTGAQSDTTRLMGIRASYLIATRFPNRFHLEAFNAENVAKAPHILIGTFTPIHATADTSGNKDAYRLCFAVVDLKSKLIVAKGFARATPGGISANPTLAFAESPVWVKDPSVDGYVRTCQGTKAGDPINPVYLERIQTAAVISDAILAYESKRYARALELYEQARTLSGGDQLRVLNGLYLANAKLNRKAEAEKAFAELVEAGLKGDRLSMMLLFRKGTTSFAPGAISAAYPAWLKTIADKAGAKNACLEVVGHTSRTGKEDFNDKLSAQRAEVVRNRLGQLSPTLAKSLVSSGKGWRENIIGTGRDDATDALDRRVEFKVAKCA